MSTFQTLADDDEVEHDDSDSLKNIVEETRYTVIWGRLDTSKEKRVRS